MENKKRTVMYIHVETGEIDTRDGWEWSYEQEELSNRRLTAEEAFDEDLNISLFFYDQALI